MGWAYLSRIGIPSLMGAASYDDHNHDFQPYEQDANRRAFMYFNENVEGFYKSPEDFAKYGNNGVGWNFYSHPLDVYHTKDRFRYYDYHNSEHRNLINSLSLSAKWYDYAGWLGGIYGTLGVAIGNGLYYNKHRVR
jgi:hypothetical protein